MSRNAFRRSCARGATAAATILLFGAFVAGARATVSPVVAVDLGTLGGTTSSPNAISDAGQIVGQSRTASGAYHAFSWTEPGGMIDLGTLGSERPGDIGSSAYDVNESGRVVGSSVSNACGNPHAFSWTQAGGMIDLGVLSGANPCNPSRAVAVNESGQVVGDSATGVGGQYHAFLWTQADGMVDLGTLGSTSYARTLNDAGQVVGAFTTTAGQQHAFSWTQADGIVDLGTLGGSGSYASAVNEHGQVVGSLTTASGQGHAFSWTQSGGMVDLGTLGGTMSSALGVNDLGDVVGISRTASGAMHAFLWTHADGMLDLGTLGGVYTFTGGFSSSAQVVNDAGQVVGVSTISGDYPGGTLHAFSWTRGGGMVDLGTLGGTTSRASLVNASGQVAGTAYTASGAEHATLWRFGDSTPPPAPSTPDLAAASDSGISDGDNVTNRTVLTFTGTAENSSTIMLLRDSIVAGTALADAASGAWSIVDTSPSGGVYSYTVTATDAAGNTSPSSEALVVTIDVVAPLMQMPANPTIDATSPSGASVSYSASAFDLVTTTPVVACAPPSTSMFAIGDTTVQCTATDDAGNVAQAAFVVRVRGAAEQLGNLAAAVEGVGPGTSLADKLGDAAVAVSRGDNASASAILKAFARQVAAQSGKTIPTNKASDLIATATQIRTVLM
jgi:probable HAF family extracellular repeat protein